MKARPRVITLVTPQKMPHTSSSLGTTRSPSDLMRRNEELRREEAEHSMNLMDEDSVTELSLTTSPSSMSSSSRSDDGFASDIVIPVARAQQQQHQWSGSGGDSDDDVVGEFSADALLFLLEEEQEELVLTGLDESIELSDLDFNDCVGDSTAKDFAFQDKRIGRGKRRQVAIAPAPCAASFARLEAPVKKKPGRTTRRVAVPTAVPSNRSDAATSTSSTLTTTKAPTGGRKRVKDELEYLRQHVNDLEDELRQLKPNHPHFESSNLQLTCGDLSTSSGGGDELLLVTQSSSSSHSSPVASSSKLWKRVASNQLDERRKAEAENARLRDLLEGQLRVARSLAKTLRKRPKPTVSHWHHKILSLLYITVIPPNSGVWLCLGPRHGTNRVCTAAASLQAC